MIQLQLQPEEFLRHRRMIPSGLVNSERLMARLMSARCAPISLHWWFRTGDLGTRTEPVSSLLPLPPCLQRDESICLLLPRCSCGRLSLTQTLTAVGTRLILLFSRLQYYDTKYSSASSMTKRSLTLRLVCVCPLSQPWCGTQDAEEQNADVCGGADDIITIRF